MKFVELLKKESDMRNDIYVMFSDYRQSFKLRWGRIFHSGKESIFDELESESKKYNCIQKKEEDFIIWIDADMNIQAMFYFPENSKDFNSIYKVFNKVRKNAAPITFIVIHQVSDGDGDYDIFRISEKSYLEHNNRVRFRKR